MKMMTKEVAARIPKRYSQEKVENPMVQAKFFCPWNNWTWFVIEGEEDVFEDENEKEIKTWMFFGYVVGHDNELGYFTLAELESVRGPGGLKIERDMHFRPTPLSEIKAKHER